jgi:hypothetical protein
MEVSDYYGNLLLSKWLLWKPLIAIESQLLFWKSLVAMERQWVVTDCYRRSPGCYGNYWLQQKVNGCHGCHWLKGKVVLYMESLVAMKSQWLLPSHWLLW